MADTEKIVREAMELHKDGDLEKATEKYKEAIKGKTLDKLCSLLHYLETRKSKKPRLQEGIGYAIKLPNTAQYTANSLRV